MACGIHFSNGSSVSGLEFDHLYIQKVYSSCDDVIYWPNASGGYDSNKVHDSQIYVPARSSDSAWGDDIFKWGGNYSVYNNYIKIVVGSYPGSQHADMFQTDGSNIKIYNNTFEDVGESIFYWDLFGGTSSNLMIYNNLFTNSHMPSSGVSRGFDLQPEGGYSGAFSNVTIANNTFVDWTRGVFLIRIDNASGCSNCRIQNNIYKNVSITITTGSNMGSVTNSNNASGNVQFQSYSQYAVSSNNLKLSSADTVAKDKGSSLASYFTTDKDGVSRAQGSAWDIGAYEFGSGGSTSPTKPEAPVLQLTN
jgi:hypothetical protein